MCSLKCCNAILFGMMQNCQTIFTNFDPGKFHTESFSCYLSSMFTHHLVLPQTSWHFQFRIFPHGSQKFCIQSWWIRFLANFPENCMKSPPPADDRPPPADDYFINLRLVPGYALYLFIDISAHDKTCNGLSFLGTTWWNYILNMQTP